jgi:ferritin
MAPHFRIGVKNASVLAAIYKSVLADKDYPSQYFLMQFMDKQTKREISITKILEHLRRMQMTDIGVLTFDNELQHAVLEASFDDSS